MCIHIYVYIHTYIYIYFGHICINVERERERERASASERKRRKIPELGHRCRFARVCLEVPRRPLRKPLGRVGKADSRTPFPASRPSLTLSRRPCLLGDVKGSFDVSESFFTFRFQCIVKPTYQNPHISPDAHKEV